jgi:hypothetical protein
MTKSTVYDVKLFERREKVMALLEKRYRKKLLKSYHVGVDPNTNRVVFATELTATANSMIDINFRTAIHYSVNYTFSNVKRFNVDQETNDYDAVPVAPGDFDLTRCWEWGFEKGQMVRMKEALPDEMVEQYKFILTLCLCIDYINKKIRFIHRSVGKDLPLQQTVYLLKKEQAEKVISTGTTDPLEVPFVTQWAEIRGIDTMQAAKEINFKFNDTMYRLIDAEKMRLTFVNRLKVSKSYDELYDILEKFDKENIMHSRV